MAIFKIIVGFISSLIAMSILASIIGLLVMPLSFIGRKVKMLAPVVTFLTSISSMFVALIIFIWFCGKIEVQPTYLMFLLPYLAVMSNNFKRINMAKEGKSRPKRMTDKLGATFDQKLQIRMEYGYLIGDLFGVCLFLLSLNRLPLY